MKSIFVTGGTGFIGSHTCLLLLEKGYEVFILDSLVNSSEKSIERVSLILKQKGIDSKGKIYFVKGDVKNSSDIERVFQLSLTLKKRIISVIHFAGLKSVSDSLMNPLSYWENNITGTINLLKMMDKYNCKNIVFSSSATVYKAQYKKLIDDIDLDNSSSVIGMLNTKLETLLSSHNLNDMEVDLIKNVSVLLSIYQTYPDLTDSIRKRILFAISYFCDENDDIPDVVPEIGYLDDAIVAKWVIESISKDLPKVSLA